MLKAAICDDDEQCARQFAELLEEYRAERGVERFELSSFATSFELLDETEAGHFFDLYLLDICLPGIDGIRLAKTVRETAPDAALVFLTTSDTEGTEQMPSRFCEV